MSITTGSGLSGGNPFQPLSPLQQELSATDQAPRQNMGITKNTDDVMFTTFGQNKYGPDKRDLYQADSSNPNLQRPLNTFRVGTGLVDQPEVNSEQKFQELLNMLPEDTRQFLEDPAEQDNPLTIALNQILQSTAVLLTSFDNVAANAGLENIQNGALLNGLAAANALGTASVSTSDVLEGNVALLADVGPNDPGYDNMTLVGKTLNGYAETLSDIIASIKNNGVSPQSQKALGDLSDKANSFIPEGNVLLNSGNQSILLDNLKALALVSGANSLIEASSSLSISLNASQIGLDNTTLGKLTDTIASALQSIALPDSGNGSKTLLSGLIAAALAGSAGIAFATLPDDNPRAIDYYKQELGTALALSAGVPQTIFNEAASSLGASTKGQAVISAALTALSLLVVNFIWTPTNTEETYKLPSRASDEVKTSLQTIADEVTSAVRSGRLSSSSLPVSAALYHASASLSDEDYGTFFSVLRTGLSQYDISLEDLKSDLKNIGDLTDTASTAFDPNNANVPTQTMSA